MKTVSIIIPTYNNEEYITRCITSIIYQTYKSIEIIIINDGSTDNTENKVKKFLKKDKRIILINTENRGVTAARKTGVSNATGSYIMFCDGDDEYTSNAVEVLINELRYNDVDLCISGFIACKDGINYNYKLNDRILNVKEYLSELLTGRIFGGCPTKIYKKEIFDDYDFKFNRDIRRGEDLLMQLSICNKINKVKTISELTYIYHQHSQSTMHTFISNVKYESKFRTELVNIIYDKFSKSHKKEISIWSAKSKAYSAFLAILAGDDNEAKKLSKSILISELKYLDVKHLLISIIALLRIYPINFIVRKFYK